MLGSRSVQMDINNLKQLNRAAGIFYSFKTANSSQRVATLRTVAKCALSDIVAARVFSKHHPWHIASRPCGTVSSDIL